MECIDCGVTYRKNRRSDQLRCKTCYPKFLDSQRNDHYLYKYGIDLADYNRMFEEQKGLCAACGFPESRIDPKTRKPKQLHVDHCHNTGRVRGLLCNNCNSALGLLKDDPARVAGLLAYAQRQQEEAMKGQEIVRKHGKKWRPTVTQLRMRCTVLFGLDKWEEVKMELFRRPIEDRLMSSELCLMMHRSFEMVEAKQAHRDGTWESHKGCAPVCENFTRSFATRF